MKEEVVNGEGYEGAEAFGRFYEILGEEALLGEKDCILLSVILFWFGSLGGLLQGCTSCWEFWARGPGILMESWS
jgi:hypothetical protein